MNNSLHRLHELGQSVWFDNISRRLIDTGELRQLISMGVSGVTSNPSIFEKAITGSADYDGALLELALNDKSAADIFESLAIEDIRDAADLLLPVFERTDGADGYASIEVSPHLADDTEGTVTEARRLHSALRRPNVMIKVPATPEGIPAIRQLIGEGINVNVTLIFSLDAYAHVRESYIGGLEDLALSGGDISRVSSVASFFVSRVDAAVDSRLEVLAKDGHSGLDELMGKAAISNAKIAYQDFNSTFSKERFAALRRNGARVQRPLWASTSTKNPDYSDVLYVEELVGRDTVNTLPDATLEAFLDHGNPAPTIDKDLEDAVLTMERLEDVGIRMEDITAKLLEDGVKSFADSYDALIANIEQKRLHLLAERSSAVAHLGGYEDAVASTIADLDRTQVPRRIQERDHTVWNPDPTEISDRLGWLSVADDMREKVPEVLSFADEVRAEGCSHVALLGMGGSSLGALALHRLFGSAEGCPELHVLDSTVPDVVKAVSNALDYDKTLFIVASKSGTTIEPNALYKHFRAGVERKVGLDDVGKRFVAICDPDTPLERLAREQGFRRIFVNPPDIGGRYSVQSLFGLAPAALIGIDIDRLLGRVARMSEMCSVADSSDDNPGAWLGAALAALNARGRDKLTLVTTESLDGFALWVEQLLAESTGKDGKGIIPISGEPFCHPDSLGSDRHLVYMRLEGDNTEVADSYVRQVQEAGIPTIRINLTDRYDIGAEFFRWQFATSVAGSIMGVHPFDQPDVQSAKDRTTKMLGDFNRLERAPELHSAGSLDSLLSEANGGDYLAITAYAKPTPQLESAIGRLRRRVTDNLGIATTFGFGPRYLHSTGQLHKGGPGSGLFLQLVQSVDADVTIPDESYTLGVLAAAQAEGDLGALAALGRPVCRVNLGADPAQTIDGLADRFNV